MSESLPQPEKREDPDIEKYLDIIIARGSNLAKQPNLEDYKDIYDKEKINADLNKLNELRAKDDNEEGKIAKKKAEALEVLTVYYIEKLQWLGEGARASRTSEYDDRIHKIDTIAEFGPKDEGDIVERLGLAIDAYSGKSDTKLEEKLGLRVNAVKGEKNLFSGNYYMDELTKVEYFESAIIDEETGKSVYRGGLDNLPPVVLVLRGLNASELFKITAELIEAESAIKKLQKDGLDSTALGRDQLAKYEKKYNKANKLLSDNPARRFFIKQIRLQLETYIEIGEESEEADPEFLDNIKRDYEIIKALDSEDADLGDLQEDLDRVEEIFNKLKNDER